MKPFLIFILFFVSFFWLFSQEEKVTYDDSSIVVRKFDDQKLKAYKSNDDFDYTETKTDKNLIQVFVDWLKRWVRKILQYFFDDISPAVGFLSVLIRIIPYLVAVIVLYLIIRLFISLNIKNAKEFSDAPNVSISEEEELIKEKDLNELLEKAIQKGNFRLAIRYYYLKVLKQLTEQEQIDWKPEKTNEEYIKEFTIQSLQDDFNAITYLYDYVWYGNFSLNKNDFIVSEVKFKNFIQAISN